MQQLSRLDKLVPYVSEDDNLFQNFVFLKLNDFKSYQPRISGRKFADTKVDQTMSMMAQNLDSKCSIIGLSYQTINVTFVDV